MFERWKARRFENRKLITEEEANHIFQICEHKGQTWVTFNGNLVCPSEWLGEDVILRLFEMRRYYIDRKLHSIYGKKYNEE